MWDMWIRDLAHFAYNILAVAALRGEGNLLRAFDSLLLNSVIFFAEDANRITETGLPSASAASRMEPAGCQSNFSSAASGHESNLQFVH
jgi:hypothetical protein